MKVSPSILAADPLRLEAEVERMAAAGCDLLHVDVMDGHFVPNLSFGPGVVKALHRRFPDVQLDVHLMLEQPEKYLEAFAEAGAWGITIHAEIPGKVDAALQTIRRLGCSAGVSVKPATTADAIQHLFPLCDLVLVMTVEPGFGGQSFNAAMRSKVSRLRQLGWTGPIEADGGLTLDNLPGMAACGLDIAVMGTAMYRSTDPAADIRRIHSL